MEKLNILIDLDITMVDTPSGWLKWLDERCVGWKKVKYETDLSNGEVVYDMTSYFTLPDDVNGFDYWKGPMTYENCEIHENAVRVIQDLYNQGHTIIFCSYCMNCPEQIKYKLARLKKEFSFMLPDDFNFFPAKKKGLIKADVFIDDRNSFCQMAKDSELIIKYNSHFEQDCVLTRDHILVDNWFQVEKEINKYLGGDDG